MNLAHLIIKFALNNRAIKRGLTGLLLGSSSVAVGQVTNTNVVELMHSNEPKSLEEVIILVLTVIVPYFVGVVQRKQEANKELKKKTN
jgi:hypothetical protein